MYLATKLLGGIRFLPSLAVRLRSNAASRVVCAILLAAALTLSACSSKTEEEILSEANAMMQEQNLLKATILYKDFLEKFPESNYRLGAQMGLAEAYYRNKEYDLCRAALDQVIEQNGGPGTPAGFQPFLTKLRTYMDESRLQEALTLAEQTSDSLATSPLPMQQAFQTFLGTLYAQNQRWDDSLATFQAILVAEPPTVEDEVFQLDLLNRCASIYEAQGRIEQALVMFEDYIQKRPNVYTRGQIYQAAGRIEARLGNPEAADVHYDKAEAAYTELMNASETDENKIRYQLGIANLNYTRGRDEAADSMLRGIIDGSPNSSSRAIALNLLASSLVRQGDFESAMALLQQVVAEYPNTREARQAVDQAQRIRAIRDADAATTATAAPAQVTESLPVSADAPGDAEPPAGEASAASTGESAATP